MLLFPGLELLRHGRVSRSLKLLNLISIEDIVIENLPLLRRTLISLDAAFSGSLGTDNIFDPVFHLNEDLLHAGVTLHSSGSTLSPVELDHVVSGVKVIMVARPRFNIELSGSLTAFELVSQLLQTSLAVNSS
jgi:hypothetical protein